MNEDLTVAGLGKAAGVFQLAETDLYSNYGSGLQKLHPVSKLIELGKHKKSISLHAS